MLFQYSKTTSSPILLGSFGLSSWLHSRLTWKLGINKEFLFFWMWSLILYWLPLQGHATRRKNSLRVGFWQDYTLSRRTLLFLPWLLVNLTIPTRMSLKETEKMHGMIHSVFSWTNVRLCELGIWSSVYICSPLLLFMYRRIVRCAEILTK